MIKCQKRCEETRDAKLDKKVYVSEIQDVVLVLHWKMSVIMIQYVVLVQTFVIMIMTTTIMPHMDMVMTATLTLVSLWVEHDFSFQENYI